MSDNDAHLRFFLRKDDQVYRISLAKKATLTDPMSGFYTFTSHVYNVLDQEEHKFSIDISEILAYSDSIDLLKSDIISARIIYDLLGTSDRKAQITKEMIHKFINGTLIRPAELRKKILQYIKERYVDAPSKDIYLMEILAAIKHSPKQIVEAVNNFKIRGLLHLSKKLEDYTQIEKLEEGPLYEQLQVNLSATAPNLSAINDELKEMDSHAKGAGTRKIEVSDPYNHYKIININADKFPDGFVFYMTQFDDSSLERFSIIKKFCKKQFSLELIISKDDNRPNNLNNTIISHIHKCKFGIADLTDQNQNVMYELGFAHAINKDVILISDERRKKKKRIFDIDNINTIYFKCLDNLKEELQKQIPAVLESLSNR